jgi:hypothetical protein
MIIRFIITIVGCPLSIEVDFRNFKEVRIFSELVYTSSEFHGIPEKIPILHDYMIMYIKRVHENNIYIYKLLPVLKQEH